jgi:hypothetical protein
MLELTDMHTFGQRAVNCLVDDAKRRAMTPWIEQTLRPALAGAGGLDGAHDRPAGAAPVQRVHSAKPYVYDHVPRRDERFPDPYNMGVNAEAFLYDEAMPARAKALMMLFKRLREIDVPEMMASIIHQTPDQPWGYYRAMSRQLWDEARHAMMGEVGFAAMGVDWTLARVTYNWSLRLNTECAPLERHAVLYFIEQGLMTRTGSGASGSCQRRESGSGISMIVRHPGKIAEDRIVIDDLGAELNIRRHDVCCARGEHVDVASVFFLGLEAAALRLAVYLVSLNDKTAAEFARIRRERNLVVPLDEHLVANRGVGRPCAVEIECVCGTSNGK